jgi:hypothetical protein
MADLERTGVNPYPLPFTGTSPGLPAGWVNTDSSNIESINNNDTHAACVIEGIAPGQSPDITAIYCFFACPAVSVPFVLFPASQSHPSGVSGTNPRF